MPASVRVIETVSRFVGGLRTGLPMQAVAVRNKVGRAVRAEIDREIRSWGGESTGKLARSFRTKLVRFGSGWSYSLESDLPYARIHEKGGTIRPRGSWIVGGKARLAVGFRQGKKVTPATSVRMPRRQYLTKAARKATPGVQRLIAASVRLAVMTARQR